MPSARTLFLASVLASSGCSEDVVRTPGADGSTTSSSTTTTSTSSTSVDAGCTAPGRIACGSSWAVRTSPASTLRIGSAAAVGDSVVVGGTAEEDFALRCAASPSARPGGRDAFLAGFDVASGEPTWITWIGGDGDDPSPSLAASPDGLVVVAAALDGANRSFAGTPIDWEALAGDDRALVVGAVDAGGALVWTRGFKGGGDPYDVAVGPDGTVYVTGTASGLELPSGTLGADGPIGFVLALDPAPDLPEPDFVGARSITGGGSQLSVAVAPSGAIAVSGAIFDQVTIGAATATVTYDAESDLWAALLAPDTLEPIALRAFEFLGPQGSYHYFTPGAGLVAGANGGWILGGTYLAQWGTFDLDGLPVPATDLDDMYLLAVDAELTPTSFASYGGPSFVFGRGLDRRADGTVLVAGDANDGLDLSKPQVQIPWLGFVLEIDPADPGHVLAAHGVATGGDAPMAVAADAQGGAVWAGLTTVDANDIGCADALESTDGAAGLVVRFGP